MGLIGIFGMCGLSGFHVSFSSGGGACILREDGGLMRWIDAGKIAYAARILYALAAGLTRLSILLFYYRLVANTTWTRAYRFILHGVVAAVVVLCTVTIGMAIWQCRYESLILSGPWENRLTSRSKVPSGHTGPFHRTQARRAAKKDMKCSPPPLCRASLTRLSSCFRFP